MTLRFTHFDLEAPESKSRYHVRFINLTLPPAKTLFRYGGNLRDEPKGLL